MITDVVAGLFFVAVIYILVRPNSKGADFVSAFGDFMSSIIGEATDLASSGNTSQANTGN